MSLVQKTDPIGLDVLIDNFQSFLFTALSPVFTAWESYPRVYINPRNDKRIPEYAKDKNDYKEVFYDDNFSITSFFVANETREINDGEIAEVDVALILQADIAKLFPLITHRADEELNNQVYAQSLNYVNSRQFKLISIENGVENVYREFDTSNVKLDDMSNQYVVRFNYRALYDPDCEIV